jgi:hypothetical protein
VHSRLQKYQSDWRLQLLLSLVVGSLLSDLSYGNIFSSLPPCRCADILLEMDDHDLHLVDQDALDLRHGFRFDDHADLIDIMSSYVAGDQYASTALHCMHFLCNPP